jgi:sugar phosphate isomerase/epimerase
MKLVTTTNDLDRYYPNDTVACIRELHRAGFRYVDLSMFSLSPDSPLMQDDWRDTVRTVQREADALGMTFVQAHSPGGNPFWHNEEKVAFLKTATLRSFEICGMLGIPHTVIHPGHDDGLTKEQWFCMNRDFYNEMLPAAEAAGVEILIENSADVCLDGRYYANTGAEMREFLSFVGSPHLHACWDTGHANCEGEQYKHIVTLGEELRAIHYNDNRGVHDDHLLPFFGTLNHDEVLNALIDAGYRGTFTLESCGSLPTAKSWPYKRRPYPADTRLLGAPLFIPLHLEALLYETGKYILDAYGLFEE